jgi:hypothetical protein
MFNRKTRNKPQAWRPLGYIPNLGLQSKAESAHEEAKIKLYHDVLRKILAPLGQLHIQRFLLVLTTGLVGLDWH